MYEKTIEISFRFYLHTHNCGIGTSFTLDNIDDEQAEKIATALVAGRRNSNRKTGHYYLSVEKTTRTEYSRKPEKWYEVKTKTYTHVVETRTVEVFSEIGEKYDEKTTETNERIYSYTGERWRGFGYNEYFTLFKDLTRK